MNNTLWQSIQNLPMMMDQFHFLRPVWLIAVIPILLLAGWYLYQIQNLRPPVDDKQKQWAGHVDNHLLPYLIIGQAENELNQVDAASENKPSVFKRWLLNLSVVLSLVAGVVAIAGPTWQQKPVPAIAGSTPTMIVLSLAQSMNATDVTPTRLQRAVHKVTDILEQTQGDQRGLVIYSDMAFTASPLTNDSQVIQKMLPELSTNLMPVLGNRLDLAIDKATELLQRGGAIQGNIIILTDGAGDNANGSIQAAMRAEQLGYKVSVLGIGTKSGGLLTLGDGRQVTDNNGQTVQTALDSDTLAKLASSGGGRFEILTASSDDIEALLGNKTQSQGGLFENSQTTDSDTNDWVDMGFLMLFIPIVLMPFAFKRGTFSGSKTNASRRHVLMSILPLMFCGLLVFGSFSAPQRAYADVHNQSSTTYSEPSILGQFWTNLWQTKRQQAQKAFEQGYFERAAQLFNDIKAGANDVNIISWQGSSEYKSGNYQKSANLFSEVKQDYNLGNALAKSGDLQGALDAYERHLESHPKDDDAIFNRDLIKKLLEEQSQNQQQDDQNKDNDDQSKDNKDQDSQQNDQNEQGGDKSKDNQNDSQDPSQSQSQDQSQGQNDEQQEGEHTQDNPNNPQNEQQESNSEQDADDAQASSEKDNQQEDQGETEDEASDNARQTFAPQPLDQATEQALRRVPDDSSGLLRARIMQYYQQQYLQQQGR